MNTRPLPVVRSHERIDFKRCQRKWYWKWRKGLIPKAASFGALELGTWVHHAFAEWYGEGTKRNGVLADHLEIRALADIESARISGAPEHVTDAAESLMVLGVEMLRAYVRYYGKDRKVRILRTELPLEFGIPDARTGKIIAVHKLKPDAVFLDEDDNAWLFEHKTAASIRTEHLVIDDQARPYGVMAEPAMRRLGVLKRHQQFKGIMYNFLRKALPDDRPTDAQGRALNQNGTVSKRQPAKSFMRIPVRMTNKAKVVTLKRVQRETTLITTITGALREGTVRGENLSKTPHVSCPKTCQFFPICVAEDEGTDIRDMVRAMYVRQDPYTYDEETTDSPPGFEMG